jgi:hypothetical protein
MRPVSNRFTRFLLLMTPLIILASVPLDPDANTGVQHGSWSAGNPVYFGVRTLRDWQQRCTFSLDAIGGSSLQAFANIDGGLKLGRGVIGRVGPDVWMKHVDDELPYAYDDDSDPPAQIPIGAVQGTFEQMIADEPNEYETYQVKFTYMGGQKKTAPSLLLYGAGRIPDPCEFVPYRTPGVNYVNDDVAIIELQVLGTTLEMFVNGLSERPRFHGSGDANEPVFSLMIQRTNLSQENMVFEHLADRFEAYRLMDVLHAASRLESPEVRDRIRMFRNFTIGFN